MNKMVRKLLAAMMVLTMVVGGWDFGSKAEQVDPQAAGVQMAEGQDAMAVPADGMGAMTSGKVRPAETGIKRQEIYRYPYLGMEFTLPESLMKKMDNYDIFMVEDERRNEDGTCKHAFFTWSAVNDEQKTHEIELKGDGYINWRDSLTKVGAIGMYTTSADDAELTELTGCSEHTQLGTSADGKYKYVLSTNPAADPSDLEDAKNIKGTVIEQAPHTPETYIFSDKLVSGNTGATIAPFSTKTIEGEAFTHNDFAKNKLTMVNIFATWCTACIQEIPDIEKLHKELAEKGVGVVGIVTDTATDKGEDAEALEKAALIKERTGATYPFLMPDATNFNGRTSSIYALPETFFVDSQGNIVGETYSGSHNYEDWKAIVEETLKKLEEK